MPDPPAATICRLYSLSFVLCAPYAAQAAFNCYFHFHRLRSHLPADCSCLKFTKFALVADFDLGAQPFAIERWRRTWPKHSEDRISSALGATGPNGGAADDCGTDFAWFWWHPFRRLFVCWSEFGHSVLVWLLDFFIVDAWHRWWLPIAIVSQI